MELRRVRLQTLFLVSLLAVQAPVSPAAELLTNFLPATTANPYGAVHLLEFETPLVRVGAGSLAHHVHEAVKSLHVPEPVWVVGYQTRIVGPDGRPPSDNYLCHTFLGNRPVEQPHDSEIGPPRMSALYSDSFTQEIELPEGLGVRLAPDDNLEWMPMFNNRGDRPVEVRMKGRLRVIRERDLKRPLRRLYSSLYSVKTPHLYFVPAGRHQQEVTFELPFDGRIHFIGTHIHPYGESIELRNESRHERVWKGSKKTDAGGNMTGMDIYSSAEGYPVQAFDTFRIISTYDNPNAGPVDAMAGVFLFYTRE